MAVIGSVLYNSEPFVIPGVSYSSKTGLFRWCPKVQWNMGSIRMSDVQMWSQNDAGFVAAV